MKGELRINKKIRVRQVRLIDENGQQAGVVATEDALKMAVERGFDLVEVSPDVVPPVCKLMDYGRFKYDARKKSQKSKKKLHVVRLKELRLRPITEEHDVLVKIKHAREILAHGDKVLFSLFFKGREIVHLDIGMKVLERIQTELADVAKPEGSFQRMGSRMFLTMVKK